MDNRVRASEEVLEDTQRKIEDENFVMQLINNLPIMYDSLVEAIKKA